ncbi:unnamed protein product, partial [Phaeothamnion confervicola]
MAVAWWRSRRPYDGVAGLDLMRHEMLRRCCAAQVWLTIGGGKSNNGHDWRSGGGGGNGHGIHSYGNGNGGSGGGSRRGESADPVGCVLFCNPNAGFYESIAAGGGDGDWVSFYTSIGCDVFLFNYRSFGRSGGTPSPARLNADAAEVATYLRERCGIARLAVHGESIGGIAAAHVARYADVDLLVLDRTFASLSAAAERLVGGWTRPAMALFAPRWHTDVVDDYLNTRCAKLVVCDPEDAIIADAASLKAGVAARLELG